MSRQSKNRHCFIPNCRGGYDKDRKVSLFKAPNDESLRAKWAESIPRHDRDLQPYDVVCEDHFAPDDVIRGFEINGDFYPLRHKLRPGAIPTVFNKPLYRKNARKPRKHENAPANIVKNHNAINEVNLNCFNTVFKNETGLRLLLANVWAVHYCREDDKRHILLSQMAVKNGAPAMSKQIVLNEDMQVKYFVGSRVITTNISNNITSVLEFSKCAEKFHELAVFEDDNANKDPLSVNEASILGL